MKSSSIRPRRSPVKLMMEVAYMTGFLSQPDHVTLLEEKLVPFCTCGGINKMALKTKGEKVLEPPKLGFLHLITSKLVKLGFEYYKLLGFCTKSESKSTMSWRLRRNVDAPPRFGMFPLFFCLFINGKIRFPTSHYYIVIKN